MAPRTEWACQPVACIIASRLAPSGCRISSIRRVILLVELAGAAGATNVTSQPIAARPARVIISRLALSASGAEIKNPRFISALMIDLPLEGASIVPSGVRAIVANRVVWAEVRVIGLVLREVG